MTYTDYEVYCSIPFGLNIDSVLDCAVDMLNGKLKDEYGLVADIGVCSGDVLSVSILNDPQWLRYKLTNPTILEDEIIDMEYMEAKMYPTGHHEITTTISLEWERIS